MAIDWGNYPNFSEDEFRCKHCGLADMDPRFLAILQTLRDELGFPFPITSGFRCPDYNVQVSSTGIDGPHTTGMAADVGVSRQKARLFLESAALVFEGIGINQKGDDRFIHVDLLGYRIWTY